MKGKAEGLRHGVTLIEMVVASTLALVVVLAVGQLDVTRILLSQRVREDTERRSEAAMAIARMARSLQLADRVYLLSSSAIQIRIPRADTNVPEECAAPGCECDCIGGGVVPQPCCFDEEANYQWDEYAFTTDEIAYFKDLVEAGCGQDDTFRNLTSLTIEFLDVTGVPPGGDEPFADEDNNVIRVTITATDPNDPDQDEVYTITSTIRGAPYANVEADPGEGGELMDSGIGLGPLTLGVPAGSCAG